MEGIRKIKLIDLSKQFESRSRSIANELRNKVDRLAHAGIQQKQREWLKNKVDRGTMGSGLKQGQREWVLV